MVLLLRWKNIQFIPPLIIPGRKKHDNMGEEGFVHGMTSGQLKRIRELEKENRLLKEIIVEKDLAGKLKDELLKKKYALEKKKHS